MSFSPFFVHTSVGPQAQKPRCLLHRATWPDASPGFESRQDWEQLKIHLLHLAIEHGPFISDFPMNIVILWFSMVPQVRSVLPEAPHFTAIYIWVLMVKNHRKFMPTSSKYQKIAFSWTWKMHVIHLLLPWLLRPVSHKHTWNSSVENQPAINKKIRINFWEILKKKLTKTVFWQRDVSCWQTVIFPYQPC